jgi:hypothetical protein
MRRSNNENVQGKKKKKLDVDLQKVLFEELVIGLAGLVDLIDTQNLGLRKGHICSRKRERVGGQVQAETYPAPLAQLKRPSLLN